MTNLIQSQAQMIAFLEKGNSNIESRPQTVSEYLCEREIQLMQQAEHLDSLLDRTRQLKEKLESAGLGAEPATLFHMW